jgi:hypothetical protein
MNTGVDAARLEVSVDDAERRIPMTFSFRNCASSKCGGRLDVRTIESPEPETL